MPKRSTPRNTFARIVAVAAGARDSSVALDRLAMFQKHSDVTAPGAAPPPFCIESCSLPRARRAGTMRAPTTRAGTSS